MKVLTDMRVSVNSALYVDTDMDVETEGELEITFKTDFLQILDKFCGRLILLPAAAGLVFFALCHHVGGIALSTAMSFGQFASTTQVRLTFFGASFL